MEVLTFGKQLNKLRAECRHPQTRKPITQIQFARYLDEEIGIMYTGTAISDWERDKSIINVNDRLLLMAIIKVLKKYRGIESLYQANYLLELGNYRALNEKEQHMLFPENIKLEEIEKEEQEIKKVSLIVFFVKRVLFDSPEEFENELKKSKEGPSPIWPRLLVTIIRKRTDKISLTHILKIILWVWIFLIGYWLIIPSFQFPFSDYQDSFNSMLLYAVGTFLVPFGIGLMINTKDNVFWREQNLPEPLTLRLYIFQGAYVGFHITYFFFFLITFLTVQFQIEFAVWVEIFKLLCIIAFSYASAHLVPYNLLSAYQRLDLRDGWIFFIFIIVGPLWAWFVLEFYETLIKQTQGIILILSASTLVVTWEIYKSNKKLKHTR